MTGVLVTGAGGQLGRELQRTSWDSGIEPYFRTSAQLDVTDVEAVNAAVDELRPQVVVNAAAYTAVDLAESDEYRATEVNGTAVAGLAAAANRVGAFLIHLSTDFVFDGTKSGWYIEDDKPNPLSAYGRSKLLGELAAARAERFVVLRTAWIYGALAPNFVTTILRLAAERDELAVVDDQQGCPTAAVDLAEAIASLVAWTNGGQRQPPRHLYHMASPNSATWHEVAASALASSRRSCGVTCRPIATAEYPTPATRPANSRLDSGNLSRDLGIGLPDWRQTLPSVVAELEAGHER